MFLATVMVNKDEYITVRLGLTLFFKILFFQSYNRINC